MYERHEKKQSRAQPLRREEGGGSTRACEGSGWCLTAREAGREKRADGGAGGSVDEPGLLCPTAGLTTPCVSPWPTIPLGLPLDHAPAKPDWPQRSQLGMSASIWMVAEGQRGDEKGRGWDRGEGVAILLSTD